MRTGSAAQLFGQLADLIDDRSNRLDRIEKRCIRRDINAGHFCQLFRCLRASGGQYLFPVIDSGLAFGFDRLCSLFGGSESIRDYIAFPKNNNGRDMMLDAPGYIDQAQLDELHIQLVKPEE